MTQRITPDDLLQRYIHEIGSRLPSKDQKDVMDEVALLITVITSVKRLYSLLRCEFRATTN